MHSVVPTGRKILAAGPTDKSVGCFHLSLRNKEQICKNLGVLPMHFTFSGEKILKSPSLALKNRNKLVRLSSARIDPKQNIIVTTQVNRLKAKGYRKKQYVTTQNLEPLRDT